MSITIGRVTTTPGARVHLAIDGRTGCGTLHHARITHPTTTYRSIPTDTLCKRCFTGARVARAQMEITSGTRWSAPLDNFLCDVRGTVDPRGEAKPYTANPTARPLAAVPAWMRESEQRPAPRTWGQLQTAFKTSHARRAA